MAIELTVMLKIVPNKWCDLLVACYITRVVGEYKLMKTLKCLAWREILC